MRGATLRRGIPSALAILLIVPFAASLGAVPSAPTALTAQTAGNNVTLFWTPSSVGPVIAYKLEVGSAPGLSNLLTMMLGTQPVMSATSVPNGTYYVRVRAIGSDGESAPSNEVIVTVGSVVSCTAPPNPPVGLAASVSGASVALNWSSGGGCAATNYSLRAGNGPGLSNLAVVNLGTALSLTTSAVAGTYYVRVVAQNAFGTSAASNEVTVQVGSGAGSAICGQLTASVASAPFGDPDKAVLNVRFPTGLSGQVSYNFTSFRRVGSSWVDYDWYRAVVTFPPGASGILIDKPPLTAWRLEFRCNGALLAQLEGPAGR